MEFEWDKRKAATDLSKHAVRFEETARGAIRIISASEATKDEKKRYRQR